MSFISLRVTPRASRDGIGPYSDGVLHVRVTAPPAGGEANAAVTKLIARALGVPSRDVSLVSGATSRMKRFEVPLGTEEIERILRHTSDAPR
ncbi:MAG: DUF167 domain-containing protein [Dehalococcoidia bacterium]|nr:DUF167 domain-containing protein [Dehalococcoidia bacterium]MCB9484694.1 DUF167 domain-containing protein [Thermoflexaceae bacterium]